MTSQDHHWITARAPLPRDAGKRTSLYLTMRDGARIALDVHLPTRLDPGRRIPTILRQTRYFRSVELARPFDRREVRDLFEIVAPLRERALARGYAWIDADVRGSGVSSGTWPVPWAPDEVRDGAEIVDWIVAQPWSSGLVGSTGVSYDGTTAEMLLLNGHAAVRAIVPRFSLFDIYEDVAFPGGAHLAWFTEGWARFNRLLDDHRFHEAIAGIIHVIARAGAHAPATRMNRGLLALLDRVGRRGAVGAIGAVLGAIVRGGRRVDTDPGGMLRAAALRDHADNGDVHVLGARVEHRDDVGLVPALPEGTIDTLSPSGHLDVLRGTGAAIYSYGGWLDGGYGHAAIKRFTNVASKGSRLLLGPWGHGGAMAHRPFELGGASVFDHDFEILRFFDLHLRGVDDGIGGEPVVRYWAFGENRWKTAAEWPLREAKATPMYLREGRRLSPEGVEGRGGGGSGADGSYVDRAVGTGERSRWRGVLASFVPADYPDLRERHGTSLHYDSDPLGGDLEMTGHAVAHIWFRADADDATVFAYLEDVAPDGRVQYVTEGHLRALHRRISKAPEGYCSVVPYRSHRRAEAAPLEPGVAAELVIPLLPTSYRFDRGHRVRLVITGADADHFAAPPAGFRGFEVLWSEEQPSRVELPIVQRG